MKSCRSRRPPAFSQLVLLVHGAAIIVAVWLSWHMAASFSTGMQRRQIPLFPATGNENEAHCPDTIMLPVIASAARMASAMIVRLGDSPPPDVGKMLASAIHRLG